MVDDVSSWFVSFCFIAWETKKQLCWLILVHVAWLILNVMDSEKEGQELLSGRGQ